MQYDVIVGVSAGSFNTLCMAGYKPEDIDDSADFTLKYWNETATHDEFPSWDYGIMEGLLMHGGLIPIEPKVELMKERFKGKTLQKKVSFETVDSISGKAVVYDYNATGWFDDDFIRTVYASMSIPFIFPPMLKDGRALIDGGSTWNVDISSAVRRCKEIVDDDKDIIVDVILVGDGQPKQIDDFSDYNAFKHFLRAFEIKGYTNNMDDYISSMKMYPDVEFRYVISPSEDISSGGIISLDFSEEFVRRCFEVGFKDAENAVKLGPGVHKKLLFEYNDRVKDGEQVSFDEIVNSRLNQIDQTYLVSL